MNVDWTIKHNATQYQVEQWNERKHIRNYGANENGLQIINTQSLIVILVIVVYPEDISHKFRSVEDRK